MSKREERRKWAERDGGGGGVAQSALPAEELKVGCSREMSRKAVNR